MNKDIKICFMGTPRFGEVVLEKLIENFNVCLVVTQPDSFTKGGKVRLESPVKILANKHNIEVFQPSNIKEDNLKIIEGSFDFIVTAAYGQFIPKIVLNSPKFLTLNVHGSDLPKYRGGAPIQRAIMAGDEYLGVTIMRTILKMDAGEMFHKSLIKLEETDNLESMIEKLSHQGAIDLVKVINDLYNDFDSIKRIKQNEEEVTFSPNISKGEEIINFNKDAKEIFNLIRGLNPNPIAKFIYNNESYKVYDSIVIEDNSNALPGTILDNKKHLIIKSKTNAIEILKIKPEGKGLMDSTSFLNGYRQKFQIGLNINIS